VTVDPVTRYWVLEIDGHHVEVIHTLGYVKIDEALCPAPFVYGLEDPAELAGQPFRQIKRLVDAYPGG
jgi:hypothetical protein